MKHIKILMDDKETRLVYTRRHLRLVSPVIRAMRSKRDGGISEAFHELKGDIRRERANDRRGDKLEEKDNGSILKLLRSKRQAKARQAFQSKKPLNRSKHVGVEIEFLSSSERSEIALDLAMDNLTQYVELKSDGSVSDDSGDVDCDGSCQENCECYRCNETHVCGDADDCRRRTNNYEGRSENHWIVKDDCDECEMETVTETDENGVESEIEVSNCQGHCDGHSCAGSDDHPDYDCNCDCDCGSGVGGHEIAIVAKSKEIADVVTRVCAVLAKHEARVNDTCGLHVHLDMRGRDAKSGFANLVNAQNILYSMVPESRYTNTYCQPNQSDHMGRDYGRYWGINPESFKKYRTVETRLHSGSVNATKILNWIQLLQKIAYNKVPVSKVNSMSELTQQVKLPKPLIEYIETRIAKHNAKRRKILIDLTPTVQLELMAA